MSRFGHPFELPLLCQSIIMIIAMLTMVQLCTTVKKKSEIIASKTRQFTGLLATNEVCIEIPKFILENSNKS